MLKIVFYVCMHAAFVICIMLYCEILRLSCAKSTILNKSLLIKLCLRLQALLKGIKTQTFLCVSALFLASRKRCWLLYFQLF